MRIICNSFNSIDYINLIELQFQSELSIMKCTVWEEKKIKWHEKKKKLIGMKKKRNWMAWKTKEIEWHENDVFLSVFFHELN